MVVNRWMKGRRGMRWCRERAAGVVTLRLAMLNDEWVTACLLLSLPDVTDF